jgi:hypothetical protein
VVVKAGATTTERNDKIKVTWNDVSRYINIHQDSPEEPTVVDYLVELNSASVTPNSARVGDEISLVAIFNTYILYSDGYK